MNDNGKIRCRQGHHHVHEDSIVNCEDCTVEICEDCVSNDGVCKACAQARTDAGEDVEDDV